MTKKDDYETSVAKLEGARNKSSEEYFSARPQIDNLDRRKVFDAGFERGCKAALSEPEAVTLPDGWVAVPVELLKDITNCFDNVPSRAHIADGVDNNLKRIAQWVNASDGGYGLYQAINHYIQAAPKLNEKG